MLRNRLLRSVKILTPPLNSAIRTSPIYGTDILASGKQVESLCVVRHLGFTIPGLRGLIVHPPTKFQQKCLYLNTSVGLCMRISLCNNGCVLFRVHFAARAA